MPSRNRRHRQPPTRGEWIVLGLKLTVVLVVIVVPGVFVAATGRVGDWWGHHEAKVMVEHLPTTTAVPRR